MYLSCFLHFYQPYFQQEDILERIVNESYRPLMKVFTENQKARATFNINGGLLELLAEKGYKDILNSVKNLLSRGQVELTGSAAYHPFLPLLSSKEALRQIKLHKKLSKKYFGEFYKPKGFFSPELAFDCQTAEIINKEGFKWMVVPEIAYGPSFPWPNKLFLLKDCPSLKIFFRHKRASVLILSGIVRSAESLTKELEDLIKKDIYVLPIMDAETFGHHRPGLEDFLREIFKSEAFGTITVSEIEKHFKEKEKVYPRESTWSNEEQDFWLDKEKGIVSKNPFLLWSDPGNPIHHLQWEFTDWVVKLVEEKAPRESEARKLLDRSLSSDQFWWASAKPWWSLEMIEAGAFRFCQVVESISGISQAEKKKAKDYYYRILEYAFQWQRSGRIRKAHREAQKWKSIPFKKRAPGEWYNQIILEFEDEMKKAAANLDFEKAIKWRDAIIKLKKGTDIYDVIHVVNELHAVRKIPSLKPVLKHKPGEISDFAKKHFMEKIE